MCGIIGIASKTTISDRSWLEAGRDAMRHRGPDDAGEWWSTDGRVGLGHRRLAIIDLSPAGHQPMKDSSGELSIVFNGEIYNFKDLRCDLKLKGHVFHTHSDTEVILAAYREWDLDCLSHFNGMFAFAIYDNVKQQIFVGRDRAGEKPLFYSISNGVLRFASELKGILADPAMSRNINIDSLHCYLAMGYVPGERCILKDVSKLRPAHALLFDLKQGKARVWRYWHMPMFGATGVQEFQDEKKLLDELDYLLEDSVRRQMVADVPIGVLLSGGVDSSLITAMAARSASNVKTFTIRFPGYGGYDETEHARLIARNYGTEHVELEAGESTVELVPMLAKQFDEPIVDSSMIPTYLVSKLIREHCTVALGGDGGDELFAGYNHHSRLLWMKQKMGWIPQNIRSHIAKSAETLLPVGFKGRNWLQGLDIDFDSGLPLIASYFDARSRGRLMLGHNSSFIAEGIRKSLIPASDDLLQRATRMDFENYLAEDILVKVDRASMINSLEVRAPFLDHRIIEFAYGNVPSSLKATPTSRKVLLKKLANRILPSEFDMHRKQGFSIPLATWLQTEKWQKFVKNILFDSSSGIFDRKFVKYLLDGQSQGRSNSERLFALVLFELWMSEYNITM